ncbi:uncharacterized protein EDB91DRAFT_1176926 [Suillus paluster]|uniref:uncharacterized protein n=1 Tax=Suillus paluster TaxID=48578 RepID=UPI001B878905|nr:uncharacterized protein EDB91DRAFT_1176926 [Suillus paluster]KAG1721048.1 hypothetical protein EDB91DRAFT_1176926 [Suillus paluster]
MPISSLQNATVVEQALTLYTRLDHLSAPRFAHRRLQTALHFRRSRGQDQETCFTYYVKANGLKDLVITTEARLGQFLQGRPSQQTFMLVHHSLYGSPEAYAPADLEVARASVKVDRSPRTAFWRTLLAQQRVGEYKRIASDHNIIAQVKDVTSVS